MKESQIRTDAVRVAFPALYEPRPTAPDKPDDLRFQATLLFPPSYDLSPIIERIRVEMVARWGKEIKLSQRNMPLKKCSDKPETNGYEDGWHYMNVKSKYKPPVVNRDASPLLDPSVIYPGSWCRFVIGSYAYDHKVGGKGVGFSLDGVQFVRDDDRLDGRTDAAQAFDPLDDLEDVGGGAEDALGALLGDDGISV